MASILARLIFLYKQEKCGTITALFFEQRFILATTLQDTVLVTGAAGFIGSHVVDALLASGRRVIGIDDFNDFYDPAWKRQNVATHTSDPAWMLVEGDIRDPQFWQRPQLTNQSVNHIIHLAARAGVRFSIQDPELYYSTNVTGTLNVFEFARRHDVPNVIFASSSSVYGNQAKVPFSESDPVDHPISPYAASKKATELLAHAYHHLHGMRATGLRFFTVYGERGRPDMAPYLFTKAILNDQPIKKFGDGSTRRDYTYIADIVQGIMATLDKQLGYEIINLGNSQTVDLNRFIKVIESITGKSAIIDQQPMQPGDVQQTFADTTKAKTLLGFSPRTSIEEGMERFIRWYQEHRG